MDCIWTSRWSTKTLVSIQHRRHSPFQSRGQLLFVELVTCTKRHCTSFVRYFNSVSQSKANSKYVSLLGQTLAVRIPFEIQAHGFYELPGERWVPYDGHIRMTPSSTAKCTLNVQSLLKTKRFHWLSGSKHISTEADCYCNSQQPYKKSPKRTQYGLYTVVSSWPIVSAAWLLWICYAVKSKKRSYEFTRVILRHFEWWTCFNRSMYICAMCMAIIAPCTFYLHIATCI